MGSKDSILNIILNIVKQGSGAKDANDDLGKLDSQLLGLGMSILGDVVGFTTLSGAAYALFDELKQDIEAASQAETTMARLGATIQSTGRGSETSTVQVHQLAESMRGLFSTEEIEAAANELMRYMDIPTSQIPGDLALIQNMAAGLGESLPQAADTLGMALETGRLRGLGFSREMQNTISTMMTAGDIAGADAIIMDQLNSKFSGQAAAALDTYAGKQAVVDNEFEVINETVGSAFIPMLKLMEDELSKSLSGWIQLLPYVQNAAVMFDNWLTGNQTSVKNLTVAVVGNVGPTLDEAAATQQAANAAAAQAAAVNAAAAAQKEQASQSQFLNDALGVIVNSDKSIKDIEDQLTTARKQGYSETGQHITDLKTKLADAQQSEQDSLLKMVDQFIFTKDVMTGKMDMSTYLNLEVQQGLITQGEADMATKWLDYANTVANNAVNANATITTTYVDIYKKVGQPGTYQPMGEGGSVEPNSYLWNEQASSRPEVFVSGGGYILTKQDAQAALGGGGGMMFVVNYSPMLSFADEAELKMRLAPLIDQLVQKSKGRF
ncbi:MAG: hypothetical protein ABSG01_08905 [Anaerolineales bacterium]|jgi:hypothetical protein